MKTTMTDEVHNANVLVAKFMGAEECGKYPNSVILKFGVGNDAPDDRHVYHSSRCLKYHESFDWLMKVVKKLIDEYYPLVLNSSQKFENEYIVFDNLKHELFNCEIFESFKSVVFLVKAFKSN